MYKAQSQLSKSIKKRQYLFDEEAVQNFHSGRMIVFAVGFLLAGIATLVLTKGAALISGILMIVSAFILFVIRFSMPKMSTAGEKKYMHIHRFRNFLKSKSPENVDKLLEEDPSYFEKMYPYAVAFGLDQVYTQKFEDSMNHAPSWFYYGNMNSHHEDATPMSAFNDFSSQFRPSEIKQVFNSAPASSSNSSSGGGFSGGSGGGFGGGGGSSW